MQDVLYGTKSESRENQVNHFFSEDVPTSGSFMQLTALHCAALVITNDDVDICQKFKVFRTKTNVRKGIRVAFRENRMN